MWHSILVDFSQTADVTPSLYYTLLVFCDSLTEESWDLQRDRRSMEAPALPLILWWSTSCLGPCLEHSSLHSRLVGLHSLAALEIPVVEGEEWAPLSIISHSPCHYKIRSIYFSDSLETPQCTPSILQKACVKKSHCLGSHSSWEEARIFPSSRTHTQYLLKGKR